MAIIHHTKQKGDLGLFKAQADLSEKGWTILHPMTEHAPFDLVAYKNGVFKRIQVKYRAPTKGKIEIKFESTWSNKKGIHKISFDLNQIDTVCIYCPTIDQCCYIDTKDIKGNSLTVRITKPKNSQTVGIRMFEEYLEIG